MASCSDRSAMSFLMPFFLHSFLSEASYMAEWRQLLNLKRQDELKAEKMDSHHDLDGYVLETEKRQEISASFQAQMEAKRRAKAHAQISMLVAQRGP